MTGQRSFNLGDSEKPDLVFFLMGGCEGSRLFLWFKKWGASGERKGIKAIKGLHIEMCNPLILFWLRGTCNCENFVSTVVYESRRALKR
jgi:hypothetical protein